MTAPHRSAIAWTDFSGGNANFVRGCTPISEGCHNCYAKALAARAGRDFSAVRFDIEALWRLCLWHPRGPYKRERPMVFLCDTGDWMHESLSDTVLDEVMIHLVTRKDVDWQLLTKRADRLQRYITGWAEDFGSVPANIWLGVTAENQAMADERIPLLLQTPAKVRFVSVEPMLELVDLRRLCFEGGVSEVDALAGTHGLYRPHGGTCGRLDWVVCGAESGPHRRPFQVAWAEDLRNQCRGAGAAFWGKQDSGLRPGVPLLIYGGPVHEWPEVATP